MPLVVDHQLDHPSRRIVAALKVACPRHPDKPIATYVLAADGTERILTTDGFRSEAVGGIRLDELPDWAEAPIAHPDGPPHFRHRFRCRRPGCGYDAQRRTDGDEGMHTLTTRFLQGMAARGIPEATITNVDGPWRVVT